MKKILLTQVDEANIDNVQIFRCAFDPSHIVEDPIICKNPYCNRIQCRDCYLSHSQCPNCSINLNPDESPLSSSLKSILNGIYLKCENHDKGCMVEIDYENYRSHTKNCKYKNSFDSQNSNPISNSKFFESMLMHMLLKDSQKKLKKPKPKVFLKKNPQAHFQFYPMRKIVKNEDLLKFTNESYENLTIPELKKILSKRNLPKYGNKSDLIDRLKLYVQNLKKKGKSNVFIPNLLEMPLKMKVEDLDEEDSDEDEEDSDEDEEDSDEDEEDSDSESGFEEEEKYGNCNYLFGNNNISDSKLRNMPRKGLELFTNDELKFFLEQRKISKTGNKDELVDKLLNYFKNKGNNFLVGNDSKKIAKKKKKLMDKTAIELKELLDKKGLPISGNKTELVERLVKSEKPFFY